ncbi:MAG: serine hydrolase [Betaproteobacteria bacterium]
MPITGTLPIARGVVIADSGDIVVAGSTSGAVSVGGTPASRPGSGSDILYARLTSSGATATVRAFGGSGSDFAFDVAAAPAAGVLVTGQTVGAVDLGGISTPATSAAQAYVARYGSDDRLQWLLTASGGNSSFGNEISSIADGSSSVQGGFEGAIAFGALLLTAPAGVTSTQSFVLRVSRDGTPVWLYGVMGAGKAAVRGVATAADGSTFAVGDFNGTISISGAGGTSVSLTSSNAANSANDAAGDCFAALWGGDGTLRWATRVGGAGADKCRGAGIDEQGDVYAGGTFEQSLSFGQQTLTSRGAADLMLLKFGNNGAPLWGLGFGSAGDDEGVELEVGADGETVLSAQVRSSAVFPDGTTYTFTGSHRSAFVARFGTDGSSRWVATSPATEDTVNYALALAPDGSAATVGTFSGQIAFGTTTLSSTGNASYIARLASSTSPPPGNGGLPAGVDFAAAADYAQQRGSRGVVVANATTVLAEQYFGSDTGTTVRSIASGSKSFSCALAAAAEEDGLLNLDDLASKYVAAWRTSGDATQTDLKSQIRIRDLLTLSSGLRTSGSVGAGLTTVDSYRQAIYSPSSFAPGVAVQYNPNSFQAFLAVFELATGGRLASDGAIRGGTDPADYLQSRVLSRIGMTGPTWQRDVNGKPNFAGGAALSALDWVKYGQFLLNDGRVGSAQVVGADRIRRCSTLDNPAFQGYGLSLWLNRAVGNTYQAGQDAVTVLRGLGWLTGGGFAPQAPADVYMAAGSGGYRLYVIPSRNLVVVRFGGSEESDGSLAVDNEFIRRLLP